MLRFGLLLTVLTSSWVSAFEVPHVNTAPMIDGKPTDKAWEHSDWRSLNHYILGSVPSKDDFSGRYKLVWTKDYLYLLAEISDSVLIDTHANPTEQYWDDDMLEIFIDEDASGGDHLENFNAFAYHLALDNQVVDIAPLRGEVKPRLFPNHITSAWSRTEEKPNALYWEARIAVHNDSHQYGDDISSRVLLKQDKVMGFMLAYGDADDSSGRQHFYGSVNITPVNGDRNLGYIDAGVFEKLVLSK